MSIVPALVMLSAIAVLAWLLLGTNQQADPDPQLDTDNDELWEAEQEVKELDAWVDPDDADEHLPDWGPGAPKS